MFGIGMQELLIILVVALVVVGPNKLPEVARTIAKGLRELRRASDDLRSTIMVDLDDARTPPPRPQPPRALAPSTPSPAADAEVDTTPPHDVGIQGSVALRAPDGAISRGDSHDAALADDAEIHAGLETPDAKKAEALIADVRLTNPNASVEDDASSS